MENTIWPLELNSSEKTLYKKALECSPLKPFETNQEALQALRVLTKSLIKSNKIPPSRFKYFHSPEYNISTPKASREEWFVRNGTIGEAIYGHAHFIPHVRYFVEGANLSDSIKKKAEEMIVKAHYKSDGCKEFFSYLKAGQLIPKDLESRNKFSDEVFKLAIDADCDLLTAIRLRNSVKNKR